MLILELLLLNLHYLYGARYRSNRHFSHALRANLSAQRLDRARKKFSCALFERNRKISLANL